MLEVLVTVQKSGVCMPLCVELLRHLPFDMANAGEFASSHGWHQRLLFCSDGFSSLPQSVVLCSSYEYDTSEACIYFSMLPMVSHWIHFFVGLCLPVLQSDLRWGCSWYYCYQQTVHLRTKFIVMCVCVCVNMRVYRRYIVVFNDVSNIVLCSFVLAAALFNINICLLGRIFQPLFNWNELRGAAYYNLWRETCKNITSNWFVRLDWYSLY